MDTKALRQKILDLAIRGKLVPQDPNDEPAAVLLERIREQKLRMVKDGKLKKKDIKKDSIIFKGEDNLHYEKFADGSVKCIEDEIPFELPDGWAWERLGNVSTIARGGSPRPIEDYLTDNSDGINWIKIGDTEKNGKYILHTREKIKPEGLSKTRYVQSGDFLLTNSMSFGRPYILKTDGCIHDGWLVIGNIDTAFNQDYLYYALSSGFMYTTLSLLASGSTVKNLKSDTVRSVLFPMPPLGEQERMARRLDQLISFVDTINTEKGQLVDIINQTKSKILELAIRGQLVPQNPDDEPASVLLERIRAKKEELIKQGKIKRDKKESVIFKGEDNSYYEKIGKTIKCIDAEISFEIPNSWLWCRLESIGNWQTGSTPSRRNAEYYDGSIPWIKTGDLNNGYIIDIPEYITEKALNETSVKLIPAGTVLIAMYGATIGKVGITTCEATTNQACCACCNPYGVLPEYLFYYLQSQKENFIHMAEGGAQPNISKEKIVATLIPVPPFERQIQIINIIKKFNKHIESIEKSLS